MSDIQYQTVKEAAERLGVMPRAVQKWASLGKLPGAVRHGNSWMIPVNAERPKDGRYKGDDTAAEQDAVHKIVVPVQSPMMIMSPFYNKPGTANSCIKSLSATPETQALFAGQVAFWQGNVPKALELILPLLDVDADFYGSLNIGMTLMTIAVWENNSDMWAKGRERLSSAPCKNDGDKKIRDIWLAVTDNAIPEGAQNLNNTSWTDFSNLPDDSIPLYLFYYAKHMHRVGIDVAREKTYLPDITDRGVLRMFPYLAEPLIVHAHATGAILPEIYLHLLCVDAYNKLGKKEKSEQHLDTAIALCLPDKLYGILAEYRGLVSNVFDKHVAKKDKDAVKEIRRLEKKMWTNWMKMLCKTNNFGLSDRQKEIARLLSIGLSTDEVAEQLGISYETVKTHITSILDKTGAETRAEFDGYIF